VRVCGDEPAAGRFEQYPVIAGAFAQVEDVHTQDRYPWASIALPSSNLVSVATVAGPTLAAWRRN
jgi:hypothetical protein